MGAVELEQQQQQQQQQAGQQAERQKLQQARLYGASIELVDFLEPEHDGIDHDDDVRWLMPTAERLAAGLRAKQAGGRLFSAASAAAKAARARAPAPACEGASGEKGSLRLYHAAAAHYAEAVGYFRPEPSELKREQQRLRVQGARRDKDSQEKKTQKQQGADGSEEGDEQDEEGWGALCVRAEATFLRERVLSSDRQAVVEMLLRPCHLNLSMCALKLCQYKRAAGHADRALELGRLCEPAAKDVKADAKALYRKGMALAGMAELRQARECMLDAARIAVQGSAQQKEAQRQAAAMGKRLKEQKQRNKKSFGKMFERMQREDAEQGEGEGEGEGEDVYRRYQERQPSEPRGDLSHHPLVQWLARDKRHDGDYSASTDAGGWKNNPSFPQSHFGVKDQEEADTSNAHAANEGVKEEAEAKTKTMEKEKQKQKATREKAPAPAPAPEPEPELMPKAVPDSAPAAPETNGQTHTETAHLPKPSAPPKPPPRRRDYLEAQRQQQSQQDQQTASDTGTDGDGDGDGDRDRDRADVGTGEPRDDEHGVEEAARSKEVAALMSMSPEAFDAKVKELTQTYGEIERAQKARERQKREDQKRKERERVAAQPTLAQRIGQAEGKYRQAGLRLRSAADVGAAAALLEEALEGLVPKDTREFDTYRAELDRLGVGASASAGANRKVRGSDGDGDGDGADDRCYSGLTEEEVVHMQAAKLPCHLLLAECKLQQQQKNSNNKKGAKKGEGFGQALYHCDKGLAILKQTQGRQHETQHKLHHWRTKAKALFCRGQALIGLDQLDEAEVTATQALKLVRAAAAAAATAAEAEAEDASASTPSPALTEDDVEQALQQIKAARREQRQRRRLEKEKEKEKKAGGLFGAASPLAGAFAS
eukprot:g2739.t1